MRSAAMRIRIRSVFSSIGSSVKCRMALYGTIM